MIQDVYQLSASQNYPVGFPYPIVNPLDLRRFHYAKGGGSLSEDVGAHNALPQMVAFATIHTPALLGDKLVVIDVAVTDGKNGDGVIAANEMAGGNIVIYTHIGYTINAMIVSNTATVAAGIMSVTMDKPLPCNLAAATMHAECEANMFQNVQTGNFPRAPVVGLPMAPATLLLPYLWLQTWGPHWMAPQADVGGADHNIEVVFRHDGSISPHDPAQPLAAKQQHAGFIMSNLRNGAQGAPFVFLQITP